MAAEAAAGVPPEAETADRPATAQPSGEATGDETRELAADATDWTATATADGAGDDPFDEPDVAAADFDHPGAEPAAAADSSERGILPRFMRRR